MWAGKPDPSAWALTLLRTLGGFLPYPLLVLAVLPWLGSPAPLPLWPRRPPPHRGPAGVLHPPLLSRVGAAGLRERPLGCSSPRPRGSGSLQRMCSGDAEKTRPPARTRRPAPAQLMDERTGKGPGRCWPHADLPPAPSEPGRCPPPRGEPLKSDYLVHANLPPRPRDTSVRRRPATLPAPGRGPAPTSGPVFQRRHSVGLSPGGGAVRCGTSGEKEVRDPPPTPSTINKAPTFRARDQWAPLSTSALPKPDRSP